ncbi:MAG: V-type ATP synthase subunit I [Planctomycetota bacterium]
MAIVELQKLILCGTRGQQPSVLEQLQQLGCVHLVPFQAPEELTRPIVQRRAKDAYRYLMRSPIKRRPTTDRSKFDRDQLIDELLQIRDRRAALSEEQDNLTQAVETLLPWGEFQMPPSDLIRPFRLHFYQVPLRDLKEIPADVVYEVVNQDGRFAYVIVIAEEPPESFVGDRVELDLGPLSELLQRLEEIEEELEELHWRRTSLTRWRSLLELDLDAADDQSAKEIAANGLQSDEEVFALRGWMPAVARADIEQLARENRLALIVSDPGETESPPTLLENPERVAGAEPCVTFYITPGYHTWDPTTIVFFSFSLFFAMIIADAGYGLLFAAVLGIGWRKFDAIKGGKRIRNLIVGIISATVVYGVLVGSYFGVGPSPGSFLDMIRIRIDGQPMMENQEAMMAITVAIGVAHLALANFITAYRKRNQLRALGHVGWAMLMIGGFLFGAGKFLDVSVLTSLGAAAAIIGGIGILFFSSDRPWRGATLKTRGMRLLDGVIQTTNLSKAFGDILSYLRLFALGLASAQLAITFNGLASSVYDQGGIGVLLALLILLGGHAINLVLGLMGGVVHGLRLNCIEFFNWGLSQEGYAFQPFTKKANR